MSKMNKGFGKRVLLAAALLSLGAQFAHAGPAEDCEQAEKEFARGGLVTAIALWKKSAEAGYAPAQARFGDILDKAEEDVDAVKWYRKAAEQGNAAGEFGLAQMYGKGEGVKRDDEEARKYFTRAAEKDYLPAVEVVAEMYKSGTFGMSVDAAQSAKWRAKAAQLYAEEKAREKAKQEAK